MLGDIDPLLSSGFFFIYCGGVGICGYQLREARLDLFYVSPLDLNTNSNMDSSPSDVLMSFCLYGARFLLSAVSALCFLLLSGGVFVNF